MLLTADEIDYNEETGEAEARGNVTFENFESGEKLSASRIEYNLKEETGRFYEVKGSSPIKVDYRPGLLMTNNPFIFQGRWAEKIKNRYILYDGFVTNCKLPKPWWRLTGPKFDIIPRDRALAYKSFFKVRRIPVLYTPVFYKSLEEEPRRSGFLTPNMGRSTRFGWMYGAGYFWAINRSYDLMYRARLFTQRGVAHDVDFRGKPRAGTEFGFTLFGVKDRGRLLDDGTRFKEGGYQYNVSAKSDIGNGWIGFANINYLSSFTFRQAFTQSFNEAIFSEVNSIGYVSKSWSYYSFHAVFTRHQLFQSSQDVDQIVIRKLPSFEFYARDRQINKKLLPVWFSMESSAGFLRRRQLLFETRSFTERLDFVPRLTTALNMKGFRVIPSIALHGTGYGSRRDPQTYQVYGQNLTRFASDLYVEFLTPTLEKVFDAPKWMGGSRMKHVIEPRVSYRRVDGVHEFRETLRFDELDILNSTSEAEVALINRIYVKRGDLTDEFLTWQVSQRRYFDPTFGGAVVPGQRNVFASTIGLTAYAFSNGPRNYSPVVSSLRLKPTASTGVEWRTDYDPLFPRMSNSSVTADFRVKDRYSGAIGHNQVRGAPGLSPNANQLLARGGYGVEGKPGWRAGFNAVYDFRTSILSYFSAEVTYNTDCCGLSFQHRRFQNVGTRNDVLYLVSFSVANIGSFGTLRKQERLF